MSQQILEHFNIIDLLQNTNIIEFLCLFVCKFIYLYGD